MESKLLPQSLKSVPELKYVNADNVARYRAMMRFFYQEYKRLRYWLKPEDVCQGVQDWGVVPGYTFEQCAADLEQLTEWGNLTSRHDGGRVATLEEYMKKKMQYLLRPYSIEIERLLETLEKVTGYGGSLEPTLFDAIADKLFDIRNKAIELTKEEALELWSGLYESFVKLHENAADYIASLQTAKAEEMMVAESFLVFKEQLTNYLQNFVQALQRSAYKIEGNLERISDNVRDLFLDKVAEGELGKPRLEEGSSREDVLAELLQGWTNLQRWFLGEGASASELALLERATKDAIARIVRSVIRIQERRRTGLSRRKELEYLAGWFAGMDTVEEAHRLAAYTFGLFPTRHLQGEDLRDSDRADISMWQETPMIRVLKSRSRKRGERQETEPAPENAERKRQERHAILQQQAEEWAAVREMVERGRVRISQLGPVSVKMRLRLLQWIGRCTTSPTYTFVTPEGVKVSMRDPKHTVERTVLVAQDGELHLLDYELSFELTDAVRQSMTPVSAEVAAGREERWSR